MPTDIRFTHATKVLESEHRISMLWRNTENKVQEHVSSTDASSKMCVKNNYSLQFGNVTTCLNSKLQRSCSH